MSGLSAAASYLLSGDLTPEDRELLARIIQADMRMNYGDLKKEEYDSLNTGIQNSILEFSGCYMANYLLRAYEEVDYPLPMTRKVTRLERAITALEARNNPDLTKGLSGLHRIREKEMDKGTLLTPKGQKLPADEEGEEKAV